MCKITLKKEQKLRQEMKSLALSFIQNSSKGEGLRQAEIFRACGLDWGEQKNATSSNQQYWIVGLLRELEKDGYIQKDETTKK